MAKSSDEMTLNKAPNALIYKDKQISEGKVFTEVCNDKKWTTIHCTGAHIEMDKLMSCYFQDLYLWLKKHTFVTYAKCISISKLNLFIRRLETQFVIGKNLTVRTEWNESRIR